MISKTSLYPSFSICKNNENPTKLFMLTKKFCFHNQQIHQFNKILYLCKM